MKIHELHFLLQFFKIDDLLWDVLLSGTRLYQPSSLDTLYQDSLYVYDGLDEETVIHRGWLINSWTNNWKYWFCEPNLEILT